MYNQIFNLHAQLLKALSHSRRLEIVHLLRDQELAVTDIYTMLDLPQANISQHLMILREAQVVKSRPKGKQVYYSLTDMRFIQASDLLRGILIDRYKNNEIANKLSMSMSDLLPLVRDPVCRMRVSPKTAGFTETYNQRNYYFCASGCVKKFKRNPKKYV